MESSVQTESRYLSKEISNGLRGLCALMVLLHHIHLRTGLFGSGAIGKIFDLMGFVAVAFFFFFSGFGLMSSRMKKGERYVQNFWRTRLLPFYVIYLVLSLLSVLLKIAFGIQISLLAVIKSVFLVRIVITYGWYLRAALVFYLAFFLLLRFSKSKRITIAGLLLLAILMIAVGVVTQAEPATYISLLAFPLGIFFAAYPDQTERVMRHSVWVALCCGVAFLSLTVLSLLYSNALLRSLLRVVAAPAFVLMILALLRLLLSISEWPINNCVTRVLGVFSLEIYLLQGLFFDVFDSPVLSIERNLLYILLVLVSTAAFAVLLHALNRYIYILFRGGGRQARS